MTDTFIVKNVQRGRTYEQISYYCFKHMHNYINFIEWCWLYRWDQYCQLMQNAFCLGNFMVYVAIIPANAFIRKCLHQQYAPHKNFNFFFWSKMRGWDCVDHKMDIRKLVKTDVSELSILKGPFCNPNMLFLWHSSVNIDKISWFPNFQSILSFHLWVMHVLLYHHVA